MDSSVSDIVFGRSNNKVRPRTASFEESLVLNKKVIKNEVTLAKNRKIKK